jgi:dihydrofolate synthase/folylpolyglutamate synthase
MSRPSTLQAWLTLLESRHPRAIDLGLERVGAVWSRMASPRPAPRVFVIAGTNGKGSTAAYLSAMLMTLGYRCGSYTSPHVFRYNERVQIQGSAVSDRELVAAFEHVERAQGGTSLSYFEFGTLAAFDLLAQAALDFAVLEVGLGGRLDAVNLIDADCAVITPVGLDHQEYLGPDRESIGREKAGIIRAGKPVICGEAEPPRTVLETAARLGAPLQRLGHEFTVAARGNGWVWRQNACELALPRQAMAGTHQAGNMATAIAALSALVPAALATPALLAQGLQAVRLPGRLQPAAGCPAVWLDVGHNPHAAQAVAAAFREMRLQPSVCVLGMLRDKDAAGVAAALDGVVRRWYCAGLAGARGRSGGDLAGAVATVAGRQRVLDFADVASALSAALEHTHGSEAILVFGSFVTVAQAAAWLQTTTGLAPPPVKPG